MRPAEMKINDSDLKTEKDKMNPLPKNISGSNQPLTGDEMGRRQLKKFGVNMSILGASIGLYYLGFFGSIDGPLHPTRIGEKLNSLGFTQMHLLITCIALFAVTVCWNWIYNLISRWTGRRFTCLHKNDSGEICGAAAKRHKNHDQKTDANNCIFVCDKGHQNVHAQFLPVKKNKWGYTLCASMLTVVCGIMVYIF